VVAETFVDRLTPADSKAVRLLGTVRRYRRQATLLLEGDRSDHVLLLREGRVKIVNTSVDGKEVLVAVRGPGELVGELNALAGSDAPRAGSVIALDDLTAQAIAAADFLAYLERHPAAALALVRQLAERLRESSGRHAEAGAYNTLHRVARELLRRADLQGKQTDEGVLVGEEMSQTDLAGLVAASRESVARALAVLRRQGLIATSRRSIRVLDVHGLRRFVG
jgi:CRP/FNR family transcriptional regulator, cyclic AMP receptor protein